MIDILSRFWDLLWKDWIHWFSITTLCDLLTEFFMIYLSGKLWQKYGLRLKKSFLPMHKTWSIQHQCSQLARYPYTTLPCKKWIGLKLTYLTYFSGNFFQFHEINEVWSLNFCPLVMKAFYSDMLIPYLFYAWPAKWQVDIFWDVSNVLKD